jgi:tRNA(fMet)-specific endonuclease VapC
LSNLLKLRPSPYLLARLQTAPPEQFTSSITLGELIYGAYHLADRTDELLPRIERLVLLITVLPFDAAAARIYGRIRAELARSGTPLAHADLTIASIALARDLTVVTANVRHFGRIPGLRVENWLDAPSGA